MVVGALMPITRIGLESNIALGDAPVIGANANGSGVESTGPIVVAVIESAAGPTSPSENVTQLEWKRTGMAEPATVNVWLEVPLKRRITVPAWSRISL